MPSSALKKKYERSSRNGFRHDKYRPGCRGSERFIHVFFFTNPATTRTYTLSLHDALPIPGHQGAVQLPQRGYKPPLDVQQDPPLVGDRKSTRLNSSHGSMSYAVFCLK